MGSTAVYGLPYQDLDDPPDGPNLGQDLAEAVEALLQGNLVLGGNLTVPGTLGVTGNTTMVGSLTVGGTNIGSQVSALTTPGYTDYSGTIAWSSNGSAPSFGTTSKTARYRRPTNADEVDAYWKFVFAGAGFGSGVYFLTLPVTAHADMVNTAVGVSHGLDAGTEQYSGIVVCETTTTVRVVRPTGASWSQVTPHTWANGDTWAAWIRYRPA